MNLKTAILLSLRNVHPCMLPQPALLVDVNNLLPTPVTRAELERELALMETRAHAIALRDALTDQLKWKITDPGLALLASSS